MHAVDEALKLYCAKDGLLLDEQQLNFGTNTKRSCRVALPMPPVPPSRGRRPPPHDRQRCSPLLSEFT